MRLRKPHPASLDEVVISREGPDGVIRFREPGVAITHLRLGQAVRSMTDGQILERFNESLRDQECISAAVEYVAVEIPPGGRQIEFVEAAAQWAPLGAVLRCSIDDTGPDGEAVIHIDDIELSLPAFGRLLSTYSGWGMRICFVPEDQLAAQPTIAIDDRE